MPFIVLTFEYFLKVDFVLKLAQTDNSSAGARNRKYIGSNTTGSLLLLS